MNYVNKRGFRLKEMKERQRTASNSIFSSIFTRVHHYHRRQGAPLDGSSPPNGSL
ncbi:hypothetical protein HanRHA438_Chr05g0231561 [Helianthus annuus]|nr:hypothetical protein HanRHA438_Chr05g0231561 [Helianthus annuus]